MEKLYLIALVLTLALFLTRAEEGAGTSSTEESGEDDGGASVRAMLDSIKAAIAEDQEGGEGEGEGGEEDGTAAVEERELDELKEEVRNVLNRYRGGGKSRILGGKVAVNKYLVGGAYTGNFYNNHAFYCPGTSARAINYANTYLLLSGGHRRIRHECFSPRTGRGCGPTGFCCRHPVYGNNVCYRRKFLYDNYRYWY